MSRKRADDNDTVAGTATDIAKLLGDADNPLPLATVVWLQRHGCIPCARWGPLWIANASAMKEAKERARERGDQWAQPKCEAEKEYA